MMEYIIGLVLQKLYYSVLGDKSWLLQNVVFPTRWWLGTPIKLELDYSKCISFVDK